MSERIHSLRWGIRVGALALAGVLLLGVWSSQRERARRAELRREVELTNRLLDYQEQRLLDGARLHARDAQLTTAVASGSAEQVSAALHRLTGEDARPAWVADAHGQRLAATGDEPPYGDAEQRLIEAALRGHEVYGVVASGPWFQFEAVAPIRSDGRVVGALRLGSRLDGRMIRDIESVTGGRLVAAPGQRLEQRLELGTTSIAGGLASARPSPSATEWINDRLDGEGPVVFQPVRDTLGRQAGLLALTVPHAPNAGTESAALGIWLLVCAGLMLAVTRPAVLRESHHRAPALSLVPSEPVEPRPESGFRDASRSADMRTSDLLQHVSSHLNHHLNNTLAVVIGNMELIRDEGLCTRKDAVEDVIQHSWWASTVLRRLQKACARERLTRVHEVDLAAVARDAVGRLTERQSGRTIEVRGLAGLAAAGLHADLVDALTALLENAVEATADDGHITIIGAARGMWVEVTVTDDGEGMDGDRQDQAADLFYTTRGPLAAGLGLAMVDGVVLRHGGWWQLHSAPGEGCSVRLDLPAWTPARGDGQLTPV